MQRLQCSRKLCFAGWFDQIWNRDYQVTKIVCPEELPF